MHHAVLCCGALHCAILPELILSASYVAWRTLLSDYAEPHCVLLCPAVLGAVWKHHNDDAMCLLAADGCCSQAASFQAS